MSDGKYKDKAGARPYTPSEIWPNIFRGLVLASLTALLVICIVDLATSAKKGPHDWCKTVESSDASLTASFSWGMNFVSVGGLPFYYNLSTWTDLAQLSSGEVSNLLSEGIAYYQTKFGLNFTGITPAPGGKRTTANGVFVLQQLTAQGPYDIKTFTDHTGKFCGKFDPKNPPRAMLAESTVTINATAFAIAYPSGTSYTGTYQGAVLVNDALAYGMYIFRHPVTGALYFKMKMRSLVPGRQIPDTYTDHTLLNENFQYCTAEFGPGTGVLQVIIGFAEALQGIFRVWLNQKADFSPLNGIPSIPPWDNCIFV